MNAGKLRDRITIQEQSATSNAYGEQIITWVDLYDNLPASVELLRGREYFQSQQLQTIVDTRITLRYRTGITPKMRVSHDNSYFNIQSVIWDSKKTRLEMMCSRSAT